MFDAIWNIKAFSAWAALQILAIATAIATALRLAQIKIHRFIYSIKHQTLH
ncbi:MAG: hypothetical protein U1E74_05785 [Paenacidovorax caeni]